MADVLGVAPSVAGLMTIADAIVRKGYKFITDVRNAEKAVEKLVDEVNNLSGVLHSLRNVVERLEENGGDVDPSTQVHYIESCYKTLKKIKDVFDEAVPAVPLSRGEKLKWPLKKTHTEKLLIEIGRHKATMTLAMSAREMTTLLQILARQDDIRDGLRDIKLSLEAAQAERLNVVISKERRKMLKHLGDVDARKWQDSNIRLRQPGTGVWFTDGAEFNTWLSTDGSKLWINGIPGAGKTILMSSVIQEIGKRVTSSHAVAFFYCDYKDPDTQQPLNILGALARQLILQDERCFAHLSEFLKLRTGHIAPSPSPEDLCELIRKVSKHFKTSMIIVDGLDEITNDRAGVTRLLSSLNTEGGQIKTLFASRPEVDIGYELADFVQVSIAAMSSDLRLYVASEIERRTRERKLRIRDPSLKDHIMTTLVDGADGMFRWVSCQMDYLCECNNDRDRREALEKLPPDLPSSYERILQRVNRSSRENQHMVQKTLHWIAYAAGYFSNEQLIQALAVRDGERFFDSDSMTTEEDILHWCSSLVRQSRVTGKLELAHFTVKEFLEAIDPVQKPHFEQYRLAGDHTLLARACLNLILCQDFDGHARPIIQYSDINAPEVWAEFEADYTFMSYSCRHWSHHVYNATWVDIENEVLALFSDDITLSFWTRGWIEQEIYHTEHKPCDDFEKHLPPTPLHWAALFALDKLCAKFIEGGMDVSQSSIMGTPLYCAILVELAIYPSSAVEDFRPPPDFPLWQHSARQKVFHQLLEAGANFDTPIDSAGLKRALTIAIKVETLQAGLELPLNYAPFMVSTLLDVGVRFSGEDFAHLHETMDGVERYGDLEDPLAAGVCGISFPELIEGVAKENWKALIPASEAEFGFFSFILNILCRGCPLEQLYPIFELDFSCIISGADCSELSRILSNKSVDPRSRLVSVLSKAIRYSSPTTEIAYLALRKSLYVAVHHSQAVVVSLIFKHNDDLDVAQQIVYGEENGETLLHWILLNFNFDGHEGVIESLISHGASVDHRDRYGFAPIELAATKCDSDTFQFFWDSAVSTVAFERSHELLEQVVCSAIRASNEPVMRFLNKKMCGNNFSRNISPLEFAVRKETSTFLKAILALEEDLGLDSTDGRVPEQDKQVVEEAEENLESNMQDSEDELMELEPDEEWTAASCRELEAFYLAAKPEGSPTNFAFLMERGLSTSHQYHNGNTILHVLAVNDDDNSFAKLQWLLRNWHAKLDILNADCLTPLGLAVRSLNIRAMEILLEAEANADILLAGKNTALHLACYLGNDDAVQALLKSGCQTSQKNNEGQTPKDVALTFGHHKIAVAIQNSIDTKLPLKENYSITSNRAQPSRAAISSFAQTEDHGDVAIRTVHADSGSHAYFEHNTHTSNNLTTLELDTIAMSSKQSTSCTPLLSFTSVNTLQDVASTSLKRQTPGGDASQIQTLAKKMRPN